MELPYKSRLERAWSLSLQRWGVFVGPGRLWFEPMNYGAQLPSSRPEPVVPPSARYAGMVAGRPSGVVHRVARGRYARSMCQRLLCYVVMRWPQGPSDAEGTSIRSAVSEIARGLPKGRKAVAFTSNRLSQPFSNRCFSPRQPCDYADDSVAITLVTSTNAVVVGIVHTSA